MKTDICDLHAHLPHVLSRGNRGKKNDEGRGRGKKSSLAKSGPADLTVYRGYVPHDLVHFLSPPDGVSVAIASVPLVVAMSGPQNERAGGEAGGASRARAGHLQAISVAGTGRAPTGDLAVAAGPGARLPDEYPV
jgi:hypothetical protein